MHELRPGPGESHLIASSARDRLIERRTRMAGLYERLYHSEELPLGDLERLQRLVNPSYLIITADDFGLDVSVNEAVEQACLAGVLTAASLMVGAPAAADAVSRARRLPKLRVGLHLVLTDGAAILPHSLLPGISDSGGRLDGGLFYRSVRCFAMPGIRRQVEAEIRAQFRAFVGTGLALDHVNVHKHLHLHPTLLEMILRVGSEYGVSAVRVPDEPLWCARRSGAWASLTSAILLKPWVALLKRRVRAAGLFHNDTVFGIAATGRLNEATLLAVLERLPTGVTEVYMHPAMTGNQPSSDPAHGYRHSDELAALLSPRVRSAISALGIETGGFKDAAAATGNHSSSDAPRPR